MARACENWKLSIRTTQGQDEPIPKQDRFITETGSVSRSQSGARSRGRGNPTRRA